MVGENEEKVIEEEIVEKTVVKNKIHPLVVATGILPSGKKLKAVIAGSKGSVLEVVAPDGKFFEYTVTIAVRERNNPEEE